MTQHTAQEIPREAYDAIVARDRALDGTFVYAVITTGIYCRPSCRARPPLRKNTRIFPTAKAASTAGFRACKRCNPDTAQVDPIIDQAARACALMAAAETPPTLETLSAAFGVSPAHFQRQFKAVTGISPKDFATALRGMKLRGALGKSSITAALYEAGFGSSSRYYAAADALLGMTAKAYIARGKGEIIRFAIGQSPLGALLVGAADRGICAIALGDDPHSLLTAFQDRFAQAQLIGDDAQFGAWMAQIAGHIEEPEKALDLPLDIRGTAFQQRVWAALRAIPIGDVRTYSDISAALNMPTATRAVANACAANAHALAIPCHRVVRRDGGLGGYRWGLARKKALVAAEKETRR